MIEIRPQPGPQETFLSTPADIAIYGGAAGGGKTFALLIEPLRHIKTSSFGAVIFRRTTPEITAEGALWSVSEQVYPSQGGTPKLNDLRWVFPAGTAVKFAHMEHEKNRLDWQGAQIPFIGFDELTHFTRAQFFYLLSRNRSTCGVRPYIRATCNPDADSWVAEFIAWWIDPETGLPVPERAGVLRWFVRVDDAIVWGDTPEELRERFPDLSPLSVTFIPARLDDNQILERADPEYRARLMALPFVERERLLNGNWRVKPSAGQVFRREWFEIVDAPPKTATNRCRYWDKAATKPSAKNADPDYTVGLLLAEAAGVYYVEDIVRIRETPGEVEQQQRAIAEQDGRTVRIREEQEGGASGKTAIFRTARDTLAGFDYRGVPATGNKEVRARPAAAAAFNGLIRIVRAPWNEEFLNECHAFPEGAHDDQVDALAGAFADCAASVGNQFYVRSGRYR